MTPFEFVIVLISIILGLGITQIMSGIADQIHQWDKVKLYWPHMLWVVLVFVLHVQQWWLTYELRVITSWQLPFFLFEILYPINLFILARILFPSAGEETFHDLKKFYFQNYRKFFVMVIILSALSAIENMVISGLGVEGWLVNVILLTGLLLVAIKDIRSEWLHKLIAMALLLSMIIGIALHLDDWKISI